MIFTLARRNLVHDRIRLAVTLTGVVFAVVLITLQIGLFIGFTKTISGIIDNSKADLWVTSAGIKNFDIALPMSERKLYQVMAVPGVRRASKLIVQFADWKKPNGGQESIEIVGYNTRTGLGGPWNVVAGNESDLDIADTIFVDELYRERLGIVRLGQEVEINDHRARVAGFTRDVRSFTTSPYVFTSFKNALNYSRVNEDQLIYILVQADQGVDVHDLRQRILAAVSNVDVFTTPAFSKKTQDYWMFSTGAGVALLIAAALGLVVGTVVVAQTLYATTMDHLPEFGTLKAMGAPNSYIYRILIQQALMSAVLGYVCGMAICAFVVWVSRSSDALILLPPRLALGMFFLTVAMCVGASYVSIHKVTRIDPAMVFKGR